MAKNIFRVLLKPKIVFACLQSGLDDVRTRQCDGACFFLNIGVNADGTYACRPCVALTLNMNSLITATACVRYFLSVLM